MNEELRLLTADDVFAHSQLMNHAFGRGAIATPPAEDAPVPEHIHYTYGIFRDGRLLASAVIRPFTVHWGGERILPMGGLAGVATFADARGQGLVDRLLSKSLERMRDDGQVISSLYPFSFSFYRRHGWDWVGEKQQVKLPLRELPRRTIDGWTIEPLEVTAPRETLGEAYTRVAQRYRGAFTADSHQWDGAFAHNEKRTTYVYACRNPRGEIAGYLLWRYPGGDGHGDIRQLISIDPQADTLMMTLLRDLGVQVSRGAVALPGDYPIRSYVCTHDMEVKRTPVFMGRLVDVPAALAALSPADVPDGALTVEVADERAPWNQGRWKVVAEGGTVGVSRGSAEPDVPLDIQALSQAYWGHPDLETLRRAGRLGVRDEAAYAWLRRLLPPACVHTWDDF